MVLLLLALDSAAQGLNVARFRVTATNGTELVAPGNAAFKIELLDAIVNGVYESIDPSSMFLMRNGQEVIMDINWDTPATQYYVDTALPAGTYDYVFMGTAVYFDAMGERYKEVKSPVVRITVAQPTGSLTVSPSSCVIPWGGSTCSVTASWNSNAPSAQLYVASLSGANSVLVAQGASGSVAIPTITAAGARLTLRDGAHVLANVDVGGTPTQNHVPQVTLTAPAANQIYPHGAAALLQAHPMDADDGVARVEFLVDGQVVGVATTAPYQMAWTGTPGAHQVNARAIDTRGAQTLSATVPVFVALPPSIVLTSPAAGAVRREPGSFTLAASATDPDGGISKVEYFANGGLVATATSTPFSASVTGLSAGTYSLTAKATDVHGLVAMSAPVAVTVFAPGSATGGGQVLTRTYRYNARHQLCRMEEPETGVTLMGYDPAGNLAWSAAGLPSTSNCEADGTSTATAARKIVRTYDSRNRLATLQFADGQGNQTWTYTPDGKPLSVSVINPGVASPTVTTYQYNKRGMLTQESLGLPDGRLWDLYRTYDSLGNRSGLRYPETSLVVEYAPNALGQATRVGAFATDVHWYPNGALKQFTFGNGMVRSVSQNMRQLPDGLSDCAATVGCTASGARVNLKYSYDRNGNPVLISDVRNGQRTRQMQYDRVDRLTHVNSHAFGEAYYEYDPFDNIVLNVVEGGGSPRAHHYCYDASWRLTNVKTGGCGGATVIGLSFDVQGNLSMKNGQGFEFDLGNRLRQAVDKEWYAYDGHGRRMLSCSGSGCSYQMYGIDEDLVFSSDVRTGVATHYFRLGGWIIAKRKASSAGPEVRYQHVDFIGSPIVETDADGGVPAESDFEPFGRKLQASTSDEPAFAGHVLDAVSGLSYMQQRYYDSDIGRFLSGDAVKAHVNPVGSFNRYWYANNNPYRFNDPDGRICAAVNGTDQCTFDEFTDRNGAVVSREQALSSGSLLAKALGMGRGSRIRRAEAGMTSKYTAAKALAARGGEVKIKGLQSLGIPDQTISGSVIVGSMETVRTVANESSKPSNSSSLASTKVALGTGHVSGTPIEFWKDGGSGDVASTFGHEILHTIYSGALLPNGGWTNPGFNMEHQAPFNEASDEIRKFQILSLRVALARAGIGALATFRSCRLFGFAGSGEDGVEILWQEGRIAWM